jgi:hypothetical protein
MSDPDAPAQCHDGVHEWSNQFGDDWTPDKGTLCDCRQRRWGIDVPAPGRDQPSDEVIGRAIEQSTLSPCRSKRGVVIFNGPVYVRSVGYNFKPRPFACDGSEACKATCRTSAIHAEQMAIFNAGSRLCYGCDLLHVKTVDGALVPSGGDYTSGYPGYACPVHDARDKVLPRYIRLLKRRIELARSVGAVDPVGERVTG